VIIRRGFPRRVVQGHLQCVVQGLLVPAGIVALDPDAALILLLGAVPPRHLTQSVPLAGLIAR